MLPELKTPFSGFWELVGKAFRYVVINIATFQSGNYYLTFGNGVVLTKKHSNTSLYNLTLLTTANGFLKVDDKRYRLNYGKNITFPHSVRKWFWILSSINFVHRSLSSIKRNNQNWSSFPLPHRYLVCSKCIDYLFH